MNEIEKKVQSIVVVPVIKLNNPDRDAVPLAKALPCTTPIRKCSWARVLS